MRIQFEAGLVKERNGTDATNASCLLDLPKRRRFCALLVRRCLTICRFQGHRIFQKAAKKLCPYVVHVIVHINMIMMGHCTVEQILKESCKHTVDYQEEKARSQFGRDSKKLTAFITSQRFYQLIKFVL